MSTTTSPRAAGTPIETPASAIAPLATHPFAVLDVTRQTHDVVTITVDASEVPITALPGQFNMLYVPGVGEAAVSISSDPAMTTAIDHTVRDVGWATGALATSRPGDVIGLRGPFGRPWPLDEAVGHDLVVVAGGIGLAPVRPALLAALARRDELASIHLVYGARTPSDLVFADDLARWADDDRVEVSVTVDRAERGWAGRVGLVTRPLEQAPFDPANAVVFTCGPEVMMRFVARTAMRRGVPGDRLWVTLERNMRCAVGTCGHCQLGPVVVCRDGPVFRWPEVGPLMEVKEL